jgi:arginine/ornithine transport system substrate-binding protein
VPVEFEKYFGAGAGVAIRKEDTALRDALDAGIKAIRDSGKWKDLAEKHVPGVDIWGS